MTFQDQTDKGNSTSSPKKTQEDMTVKSDKNATMASTYGSDHTNMCTTRFHVQEQVNIRNTSLSIQTVANNDSTTLPYHVNTINNSDSTTNIEHTERRILQTIAARTVLEMGFTSHQVVDAVREIQRLNSGKLYEIKIFGNKQLQFN